MMTYAITSVMALTILALFIRGGTLHNHLVLESECILQNAGFKTYQEHPKKLPDGGLDFVDLLVEKKGFMVCIEVETSARYVLTNAAKAEQLGLPLVVVVPTRKVKRAVRNKLRKTDIRPGDHDIYILLLSQLKREVSSFFPLFSSVSGRGKTNNKSN